MSLLSEKQRTGAVEHCQFLIDHKGSIGYEFGGGLSWMNVSQVGMAARFRAGETWTPDCRASVLWVCKWSGWRSPSGLGWSGSSGEMWAHLPHFSDASDCRPGTLVTYGDGGVDHVCMVMAPDGDDPWLMSHGSAEGPLRLRLSEESAAHVGQPVTFLAVGGLG